MSNAKDKFKSTSLFARVLALAWLAFASFWSAAVHFHVQRMLGRRGLCDFYPRHTLQTRLIPLGVGGLAIARPRA